MTSRQACVPSPLYLQSSCPQSLPVENSQSISHIPSSVTLPHLLFIWCMLLSEEPYIHAIFEWVAHVQMEILFVFILLFIFFLQKCTSLNLRYFSQYSLKNICVFVMWSQELLLFLQQLTQKQRNVQMMYVHWVHHWCAYHLFFLSWKQLLMGVVKSCQDSSRH